MVTIVDYTRRERLIGGEEFFTLTVQGGIELVMSKESGRYYATAKKASLSCTFDESTCKSLVGSELPGSVQRVKCDPYQYLVKDTGEMITLEHRWEYSKEATSVEEAIHEGKTHAMA